MSSAVTADQMLFTGANLNAVLLADRCTISKTRSLIVYCTCVLLPLVALLWILRVGSGLAAPLTAAAAGVADSMPASSVILRPAIFLTQIIVIIAISRLIGAALRKLGQPRVIGEMLAGLMLGPSLLGTVAPHLYAWLFPFGTIRFLSALAQTGLVLFMFLVGLELDVRELLTRRRETVVVSHASIMIPMLAGTALALLLYRNFAMAGTEFRTFALFLGCAMSITALPVLARILRESGLNRSAFGATAISCAAVADVSAWIIFALTVSIAHDDAANAGIPIWHTIAGMAVYLLVMITLVRPLLQLVCRRRRSDQKKSQSLTTDQLGVVLLVVLLSAAVTEFLKIHAIFGAFVVGVVMPREKFVSDTIHHRLDDLLSILLLPLFFAYAGLRTNVAALASLQNWIVCGLIVAIAVISKIGSCLIAGRATGMPWRTASGLGVLMNARGLMELVLLTIGLQLGLITPLLFTIMVVMAVSTTLMTTPLFSCIMRRSATQPTSSSAAPAPNCSLAASPAN